MEIRDPNLSQFEEQEIRQTPPSINILTMFRLGLFQMGLGTMSILTLGVLNRVMIDELKVPALLTAGAIAMHQFVAPARLWFGQMSDARPVLGTHRTGYVWIGTVLFTIAAFIAVQVIWQINTSIVTAGWTAPTYGWIAVLGLVFAGYGLALSLGSTPFAALLVDISDEHERSKLVGVVWSMLMVGIVVGAILSSTILDRPEICGADILTYDPTQTARVGDLTGLRQGLNRLFLIVPAAVIGLSVVATVGIERKYSRYQSRSAIAEREDQITLKRALRVLTANRQTGVFFSFLLIMTVGLFMQEAVMEPYGGEVFGMCVSETTQLNAFWGMGTLVGLGTTGFLIVPRIGKLRTARLGCWLSAGCFGLMILAGFSQNPQMLQLALLLFGVAAGITTSGALSLMLDFTAAETAGTFIGAWGLSQALARASATVSGGAVLDMGRAIFPSAFGAYALVFALQAGFMLLAVQLLSRVNVQEFKKNASTAIANILASDLD
ncbi:MAG: BCD family MFS transporter [Leptolyngbyaceae bacterium]|nr:BCD family MFS transporter [Leptolyngbyaceae bacterium]